MTWQKGDKKNTLLDTSRPRAHSPRGQRNRKKRKKRNLVESFERCLVSFLVKHDLKLWRPKKHEFYRPCCRLHGHHLLPQVDFQPLSGPCLSFPNPQFSDPFVAGHGSFASRGWVKALALRGIAFQLSECRPGEVRSISDLPSLSKIGAVQHFPHDRTIAPGQLAPKAPKHP